MKRRASGKRKTNVYQDLKSGKWFYRFKHNKKEFVRWFGKGPQGKADAELAYEEIIRDIRIAEMSGQGWEWSSKLQKAMSEKTFDVVADDFIAQRVLKPSSLRQYRSVLHCYLLPKFANLRISQITDTELGKFQNALSQQTVKGLKSLSACRINTIMQVMRTILGQEYRAGRIDRDPSLAVKRVQEAKAKIDPLSESELDAALAAIDKHYRPLFIVLAYTGARPNEILALRWSDITMRDGTISITKGRVRGLEGKPKTRSSERELPMTPPVVAAFQALKENQTVVSSEGYIFTTKKGTPINKGLDRIWSRALKNAKIRHRPSYQLRHTFATQCIIKGLPLPYIAKILGHSTIDTLIRHYAGWIDSATQEHHDKLKEAFAVAPERLVKGERS